MIKILSIGNSFSEDAQRYLYGIARADGVEMKTVNLYIGGCSLARHYRNMLSEERAYDFQINGMTNTGIKISLKEALLSDEWDYVTLQQASMDSVNKESYNPYLESLVDYIKLHCPKTRICFNITWAYKEGSARLEKAGFTTHDEMARAVYKACEYHLEGLGIYNLFNSGKAVQYVRDKIADDIIYRDDFHMSRGFGRYLLGLLWYGTLTRNFVVLNSFDDFDEPVSKENILFAKYIVSEILCQHCDIDLDVLTPDLSKAISELHEFIYGNKETGYGDDDFEDWI